MRCCILSCGCVWVLVFYWELVLLSSQGILIIKLNQSWWKSVLSLSNCKVFSLVSLALISSLKNWLRQLNLTKMLLLYHLMIILRSENTSTQLRLVSSTEVLIIASPFCSILLSFTVLNMSVQRPSTEPSVCTKGWQWARAAYSSPGRSCPGVLAQLGTGSREESLLHLGMCCSEVVPAAVRLSEMILSMSAELGFLVEHRECLWCQMSEPGWRTAALLQEWLGEYAGIARLTVTGTPRTFRLLAETSLNPVPIPCELSSLK